MPNDAKLAELRARTDRELLVLIQRELDRALPLADVVVNRESAFYGEAETGYRKVLTLLLRRHSDEPKLEIGDTVPIKNGVVGVVVARFAPSGERLNEVHYVVELKAGGGDSDD